MSKIRLGLVGCGYWGPNLLRNFWSAPGCDMRVICDLDPRRLEHLRTRYAGVETCADYDELVARKDIDAVVIATSVGLHYAMAKKSLLAGKHTFVEKPLARTVRECEELGALAHAKGLTLMVGHTFLFSPPVRRIREIIAAGDIGEIRYMSCRRLNLGLFQKDINVAWDLAPHDISVILYLLGELPRDVNCVGNCHVSRDVEDVTTMCLNFSNHVFATIQNSWLDPRKVREMTIVGSRRMIVYNDVEPIEKLRIYDMRVETPPHYDTFAEFHYSYHYGDSYIPHIQQEEPLRIETQHFLDCIRSGDVPLTDAGFGARVVRVLEAASQSLRLNGAAVESSYVAKAPASAHLDREMADRLNPAILPAAGRGNGRIGNGNGHSNGNGAGASGGTGKARNGQKGRLIRA